MNIRAIATTAAFAIGIFTAPIATAQLRTVTVTGVIDWGYDETGVFGSPYKYLDGQSFTASITGNVNPDAWQTGFIDTDHSVNTMYGTGPAFTVTLTVNGWSTTFTPPSTTAGDQLVRLLDELTHSV